METFTGAAPTPGGLAAGIDATGVSVDRNFEAIPGGEYQMQFESFVDKETKAKTGRFVRGEFTVIGGEHDGAHVWVNFNYMNPSEKAVEIGIRDLKRMVGACHKVNAAQISMITEDLLKQSLGKELIGKVVLETDERGESNSISDFFTVDGLRVMEDELVPRTGTQAAPAAAAPVFAPPTTTAPPPAPATPTTPAPATPSPAAAPTAPAPAAPPAPAPEAGGAPWPTG